MNQKINVVIFLSFLSIVCMAKEQNTLRSDSVYNISTTWNNQNSEPVKLQNFRGKPVVLAMVYTSCRSACPLIASDMQKIEEGLSSTDKDKVQFALFSFDTENDLPHKLKEFAQAHKLDLKRWSLMTAQPSAVRELAAVLGVQYKENASGNFSHSNIITILDADGKIQSQQLGLKQDPKTSIQVVSALLNKKQ